jgi:hypothetical protein
MGKQKFFIPYKLRSLARICNNQPTYVVHLAVNVFGAAFVFIRKFFLKDTGRKLSHLDKQLHTGGSEVPAPWFEEESD